METIRDDILVRVRRVLIDSLSLNIEEDDLQYSESLDQVIGLDSLAVLEFIAALEKEFGITIEQEKLELSLLRDLSALADYIQSLSAAPPASDTPA
jgi:acyl carrier protein